MTRTKKPVARPARRRRGEGSIQWVESKGLYVGQITINGKRKAVARKTEGECVVALQKVAAQLRTGKTITPQTGLTVRDLIEHYLANEFRNFQKSGEPGTARNHRFRLLRWVVLLGPRPAAKLTVDDIERAYKSIALGLDCDANGKRRKPAGVMHVKGMRTALGYVFDDAETRGVVADDFRRVLDRARLPIADVKPAGERTNLEPDEMAHVLACNVGTRAYPMLVVAFSTGIRPGELGALYWEDLHLDDRQPWLDLRRAVQVQMNGSGKVVDTMKTKNSRRRVELTAAAVTALRAQRVAMLEERVAAKRWANPDLVFPTRNGNPYLGATLRKIFVTACKKADVDYFVAYETRHTYGTLMQRAGVDPYLIADSMGHTIETFNTYYRHGPKGIISGTADVMEKIIS